MSNLFIGAVAKTVASSGSQESDNSPQPVMGAEATPDCSGESGRRGRSQYAGCRKERHNLMERERRWADKGVEILLSLSHTHVLVKLRLFLVAGGGSVSTVISWTRWCPSVTPSLTKSPLCSGPLPTSDTSTEHAGTLSERYACLWRAFYIRLIRLLFGHVQVLMKDC